MSIELTDEQKKLHSELVNYITDIEKAMATVVDNKDSENVSYCLSERVSLLSTCPRMMELATSIYNWAKGKAAEDALVNENIYNAKQSIQLNYFNGRLAKWDGLYTRAERCSKDLVHQIDGLRSILSYNKSLNIN